METFIIYLIKVNIVISILFLFYFLFLRNEKFLQLNRFLILSILLSSFLLPFITAINFFRIDQIQNHNAVVKPLVVLYNKISKSENTASSVFNRVARYHSNTFGITFTRIAFLFYILIAILLLLRFSFKLGNLYSIIKHYKKQLANGIIYCEHELELSPFSFFNYFVINKTPFTPLQLQQIEAHETVHIRQWHIIDILFSELTQIILWINPVAFMLKTQVKLNLEYIADENVLNNGVDKKEYQMNILQTSIHTMSLPLANLFNSSKLKLRIKMMNSEKTPARNLFKYAFILPIGLAAYFIVNPLSVQTLKAQVQKQMRPQQIDSIISNCMNAMGGSDNINALKTIHLESTITLSDGSSGISIYNTVYGDSYRHETIIGNQKVLLCESASQGWKMNPKDQVGTELSKNEIAEYRPDLYPGGYLFNYAALVNRSELIGKEDSNGITMYHIKVSTKDSVNISYYINAGSYEIIKEIREYNFNGNNKKRVLEFSNFKKTGEGFVMPFKIAVKN